MHGAQEQGGSLFRVSWKAAASPLNSAHLRHKTACDVCRWYCLAPQVSKSRCQTGVVAQPVQAQGFELR